MDFTQRKKNRINILEPMQGMNEWEGEPLPDSSHPDIPQGQIEDADIEAAA